MIPISTELEFINSLFAQGRDLGISQVSIDNVSANGRIIKSRDKDMVFFGNCSYLGLETDPRLKEAAIEGIHRYGTFFSSSRAFLGMPQLNQLEDTMEQIFGFPVVIAQTSAMGSMGLLPLLINEQDLIILDQQVHNTVATAVQLCKAKGTKLEVIRHNRMDLLEEKIKTNASAYRHIWYVADGIYSMLGDTAPMSELHTLLQRYDHFYCFVDDAHGMSWTGERGRGWAMSQVPSHPKMVYIMSLCKSFASGGVAIVLPDAKTKELVKNCLQALIFSGPLSPAALFAGLESARIHLSDELAPLQQKLDDKIQYFIHTADEYGVSLEDKSHTPVFYVKWGSVEKTILSAQYLQEQGYFISTCAYPSVAKSNSGIRFSLTNHLTKEDIHGVLKAVATIGEEMEDMKKSGMLSNKVAMVLEQE